MDPEKSGDCTRNRFTLRIAIIAVIISTPLVMIGALAARQQANAPAQPPPVEAGELVAPLLQSGDLPGEFEHHEGVLVCWIGRHKTADNPDRVKFDNAGNNTLFNSIVAIHKNIKVVVLVSSNSRQRYLESRLNKVGIDESAVRVVHVPYNSCWIRDYGPFALRNAPGGTWITPEEFSDHALRPLDWSFSEKLATQMKVSHKRIPLTLDGGNLLSNGDGLLITTTQLIDENRKRFGYSPSQVDRLLREHFGAKRVVVLDRLAEEPTGHVDMFATFTARDTIVLGEYEGNKDPRNQEVLERNRKRLAGITVDGRPLKIVRIPMPPRGKTIFGGSYTNVVFANGKLLVPSFASVDADGHAKAVAVYRRLLPDWDVQSVDSAAWIVHGGSLHCLTKNLYRLPSKSGSPTEQQWPTSSSTYSIHRTVPLKNDDSSSF